MLRLPHADDGPGPPVGLLGLTGPGDFELLQRIFSSPQCTVYRARHVSTGSLVAIKQRTSPELGKGGALRHEVDVLLRFAGHPFIVQALGDYEMPKGVLHLVLEWSTGGDLLSALRRRITAPAPPAEPAGRARSAGAAKRAPAAAVTSPFQVDPSALVPEATIWRLGAQLFDALEALAAKHVVHRDVKCANLLLFSRKDAPSHPPSGLSDAALTADAPLSALCAPLRDPSEPLDAWDVKLADFGVCRLLAGPSDLAATFFCTPAYASPELLALHGLGGAGSGLRGLAGVPVPASGRDRELYGCAVDVWAAGIVLYELACLRLPFVGASLGALAATVRAGRYSPIPDAYSSELARLIDACLSLKPAKRPTATEALHSCRQALALLAQQALAAASASSAAAGAAGAGAGESAARASGGGQLPGPGDGASASNASLLPLSKPKVRPTVPPLLLPGINGLSPALPLPLPLPSRRGRSKTKTNPVPALASPVPVSLPPYADGRPHLPAVPLSLSLTQRLDALDGLRPGTAPAQRHPASDRGGGHAVESPLPSSPADKARLQAAGAASGAVGRPRPRSAGGSRPEPFDSVARLLSPTAAASDVHLPTSPQAAASGAAARRGSAAVSLGIGRVKPARRGSDLLLASVPAPIHAMAASHSATAAVVAGATATGSVHSSSRTLVRIKSKAKANHTATGVETGSSSCGPHTGVDTGSSDSGLRPFDATRTPVAAAGAGASAVLRTEPEPRGGAPRRNHHDDRDGSDTDSEDAGPGHVGSRGNMAAATAWGRAVAVDHHDAAPDSALAARYRMAPLLAVMVQASHSAAAPSVATAVPAARDAKPSIAVAVEAPTPALEQAQPASASAVQALRRTGDAARSGSVSSGTSTARDAARSRSPHAQAVRSVSSVRSPALSLPASPARIRVRATARPMTAGASPRAAAGLVARRASHTDSPVAGPAASHTGAPVAGPAASHADAPVAGPASALLRHRRDDEPSVHHHDAAHRSRSSAAAAAAACGGAAGVAPLSPQFSPLRPVAARAHADPARAASASASASASAPSESAGASAVAGSHGVVLPSRARHPQLDAVPATADLLRRLRPLRPSTATALPRTRISGAQDEGHAHALREGIRDAALAKGSLPSQSPSRSPGKRSSHRASVGVANDREDDGCAGSSSEQQLVDQAQQRLLRAEAAARRVRTRAGLMLRHIKAGLEAHNHIGGAGGAVAGDRHSAAATGSALDIESEAAALLRVAQHASHADDTAVAVAAAAAARMLQQLQQEVAAAERELRSANGAAAAPAAAAGESH